jgi:putative PIG3 family NAD(P)H quinone oxidoreductase
MFERQVIFPAAGLDPETAPEYYAVLALLDRLSYAGNEAASAVHGRYAQRSGAADWLESYALMSRARAEQRVRFIDQYGSYVINYNLGKDLVGTYLKRRAVPLVVPRRSGRSSSACSRHPGCLRVWLNADHDDCYRNSHLWRARSADSGRAPDLCPHRVSCSLPLKRGVNRPDLMQRRGSYPPPPGASDLPGLEVAGRVAAIGSGVTGWQVGDRVCALLAGGGYATRAVAPAPQCLPIPRGLDMVSAAALPETFFTVWTNLFERARLRTGESVLIHGGASGIGTTAIQLAAARGARVFATAGSDDKCRACERLGAERGINYRTEDFVEVVTTLTAGDGVDVILDMVGGSYLARNLSALATEGRLSQIAIMGGESAPIDLRRVLVKRLTITGSTLRPRTPQQKGEIALALQREVWPLLESGRVKPVLFRTFPLRQAADAHRLLEAGEHIGKIVLVA